MSAARAHYFEKTWSLLFGETIGELNYWVAKGEIPVMTRKPLSEYPAGLVPEHEIMTIPFDAITVSTTSRQALNILLLGGSGDGKSLLMKVIWYFLWKAGYFILYIDPKSTDSGRAQKAWKSQRLPPNTEPEGIALTHFIPIWATKNYEHLAWNFDIYSEDMFHIQEKEMWQGLGMTNIAAAHMSKIIKNLGRQATLSRVKDAFLQLKSHEIPESSINNALRVIADIEYGRLVDDGIERLDMMKEWKKGRSVCVSYNNAAKVPMTFDIGHKIWQCARYYHEISNKTPIMIFFDDSSFYAQNFGKIVDYNFAVEQIKEIGYNYRSLGVYNCLAVQSLAIIDSAVAESYKIKIISPLFMGVDSLASINIPKAAIEMLRDGELLVDRSRYLMQYIFVDQNNQVSTGFPLTPPCGHFDEVYFEREKGVETNAESQ